MEKARAVFLLLPLAGAAAGYLIDGASGAASGFVIPLGPLLMAWILDAS
jgi:hypothetical protein